MREFIPADQRPLKEAQVLGAPNNRRREVETVGERAVFFKARLYNYNSILWTYDRASIFFPHLYNRSLRTGAATVSSNGANAISPTSACGSTSPSLILTSLNLVAIVQPSSVEPPAATSWHLLLKKRTRQCPQHIWHQRGQSEDTASYRNREACEGGYEEYGKPRTCSG